jgi:hypothetical protein
MRSVSFVVLAVLLCGAAIDGAWAQQQQQQEVRRTFAMAGTFEFGGSAAFSSNSQVVNGATADPTYSIALSPVAGYFVTEGLEIVVNPLSVSYSWSGNITGLSLMPMAGLAYNFRANPRAFPYLEGVAGYAYNRVDNGTSTLTRSGLAWAGRGGVKFLVTGTALVNIGLQYQQVTLKRDVDTERSGYNLFSASAGLTVWL